MTQIEIAIVIVNGVVAFGAFWMFDRLSSRTEVQIKNLSDELDETHRIILRHKRSIDDFQVRSEESHRLLQEYFDLELYTPPPANTKPYLRIKPVRNKKDES